jgi:hypothetical protein
MIDRMVEPAMLDGVTGGIAIAGWTSLKRRLSPWRAESAAAARIV